MTYLGPFASRSDEYLDKGSLLIVPVTPVGQDPDRFEGPVGTGISYRLAYRFAFVRPGVTGTWKALVAADSWSEEDIPDGRTWVDSQRRKRREERASA